MQENVGYGRARVRVAHIRKGVLLHEEERDNLITKAGRDFIHAQAYRNEGGAADGGLSWIALSDSNVTENSDSTTLSGEITNHGLQRQQGTVDHDTGTNLTTVQATFTATAHQACKKAALFSADFDGGVMNHVIGFSERTLETDDTLQVTFSITLG